MGSSWQTWKTCKASSPTHSEESKGARKTKNKHFKRFGRTNTMVNNTIANEEVRLKESAPKVRRKQQHTMVGNKEIKDIDIQKIREENKENVEEVKTAQIVPKEPVIKELQSLTTLEKEDADERELFLLKEAFSKHFLLGNISLNAIDSILKEMDYYKLGPNRVLFEQGDPGMHLFILTKGLLDANINGETVSIISEGNAFGEIALMYSCKRTAQIKSKEEEWHLWTIHGTNFREIMKGISNQTTCIRTNVVKELRVFWFIEIDVRNKLSEYMIPMKFNKGDVIIRKGIKETLYIITKGKIKKHSSNNSTVACSKEYKKGRIIGFSTMINQASLHDTYIWDSDVDCFNITGATIRNVFGKKHFTHIVLRLFIQDALEEKRIAAYASSRANSMYDDDVKVEEEKIVSKSEDDNSPLANCCHFLERLTSEELTHLSQLLEVKQYEEGEVVFESKESKNWNDLIIVLSGAIKCLSNGTIVKDYELIYRDKSNLELFQQDVVAQNFTITAQISSKNIKKHFGSEISDIIDRSTKIKIIKGIYLFSLFSEEQLLKILSQCDIRHYSVTEPIIKEGGEGNSLYMIAKGEVEIKKGDQFIRTLGKYEYFGERSLLFSEVRSASVFATKKVEVLELNKESFLSVIDHAMRNYLEYRIQLQDSNLDLSDLIVINKLGYGNFGSVWKVMSKNNKILYALKMVSKSKIIEYDIEQNIRDERKILARIDHPFIMKLVKFYDEDNKIFFLTELVKGDDLFNALNYLNILDKSQGIFYFASLLLITEYLHLRNILYRDFKPENIMIDETGYLKLIDFGAAKIIKDRTFTIIGTPSYTAPEVYVGEGYSYSSDYWSLGVCLYEFLCGDLPFGGDNDMPDPLEVYKTILSGHLEFPSFYKDELAKDLMRQMLNKDLEERLTTIEDIKSHPWWYDFKFDDLIMRKIKAPYQPEADSEILDPKKYQTFDELFRKDSRAMRMSFTNENGIEAIQNLMQNPE